MNLKVKYMSGAGNLFTVIDLTKYNFLTDLSEIARIACGYYEEGSKRTEGLLAIRNSHVYDFECFFYNPDGSSGMMCGNGGRCAVRFAKDIGFINSSKVSEIFFYMAADEYYATINEDDSISLKLPPAKEIIRHIKIKASAKQFEGDYVNVGSDHFVVKVDDIEEIDVQRYGKAIRQHKFFQPDGTNVNFYEDKGDHLRIRTFERGVEAETGACGTGTISTALVYTINHDKEFPVKLIPTSRQELKVDVQKNFSGGIDKFILTGPAEYIGEAEFDIKHAIS